MKRRPQRRAKAAAIKQDHTERNALIVQMRIEGHTLAAIGKKHKLSPPAIQNVVDAHFKQATQVTASKLHELRAVELGKLDRIERKLWPLIEQRGKGYSADAVDLFLKVSKRRSNLIGLDMPVKVAATNSDGSDIDHAAIAAESRMALLTLIQAAGIKPAIQGEVINRPQTKALPP